MKTCRKMMKQMILYSHTEMQCIITNCHSKDINDINTIISHLRYHSLCFQFDSLLSDEYDQIERNDKVIITFNNLTQLSPKQSSHCLFLSNEGMSYERLSYQQNMYLSQFISCSSIKQIIPQFSSIALTIPLSENISQYTHIIRLIISSSSIQIKWLPKSLTLLSLNKCKSIQTFIDFTLFPSLTHLLLDDFNCTGIKLLPKISYLSIKNCSSLISFPSLLSFTNLQHFVFENNHSNCKLIKPLHLL